MTSKRRSQGDEQETFAGESFASLLTSEAHGTRKGRALV